MKITRLIIVAIIAVFAIVTWRLLDREAVTEVTNLPVVAASNYPVAAITQSIAGGALEVVQIVPAGADPHVFEPTPSLVTTMQNAEVIYMLGEGYDDWIANYAEEQRVIRVTDGMNLRTNDHGETDPHVWLSIPNAISIASAITRDLSNRFPTYDATFQDNYARFAAAAEETNTEIRKTLANIGNTSLVTAHDAWYYFAEEYGFTVINTFEEDHGTEPSSRHLANLAADMRAANLTTIFTDAGAPNAALTQFAQDNNFTIITVDPEGIATYESYLHLMLTNAQAFSQNR